MATSSSGSAATGGRLQPRVPVSQGGPLADLHHDPDRVRTPLIRQPTARLRLPPGTRPSRSSPTGCSRCSPAAIATRWALPRQPQRSQPRQHPLRPGSGACARVTQHLFGFERRPAAQAARRRSHVRHRSERAGARRRPHGPPADPRGQSAGLQRFAAHRPGHAGPAQGDSPPRGKGDRRRSAALPHGKPPTSSGSGSARHRRAAAVRARPRAVRRRPR